MLGLGNILTKGGALLGFPNKYSFNFDGSNDYLYNESPTGLPSGDTFTISAWIKVNASHDYASHHFPIFRRDEATNNLIFVISNSTPKITLIRYGAETKKGNTTISDDTWHHVAVSVNNLEATFYLNGSADGTQTFSGSFAHANELSIGQYASDFADGNIDEVAVWNTALSASDVAKIASKPVDFSKASTYATDRTANLKLWLRAGDKVLPESDTSIARSDFYTDFDGTNDYVSVADNDDLSFGDGSADTPLSMCAWVYPIDSTKFMIFDKSDASNVEYTFQTDSGDNLGLALYDNTSSNYITRVSTDDLAQNVWSHVAVTYDGSGSQSNINVYINGKLNNGTASTDGTYVAMHNTSLEATIGRRTSDTSYADGKISNLAVYKTQLDAQTISQMAKSRFTPMRDNRFSVVDMDGSNDRITTSADSTLADTTYTYWAKSTTTGSNYGVFGHGSTSIGAFAMNVGNTPFLSIGGSTNTRRYWSDTSAQDDGQWHHWAVYVDSTNISNAKLYVDGVLQTATSTNGSTTIEAYSEPLTIGASQQSSGDAWEGSFAQFAVYSGEKDSDFIYAQYQKGITADYSNDTNLTGYWRMGDDTSKAYPTIADSSSNSNDGTITNGASDDIVQQMVAGYDMGAFESTGQEVGGDTLAGVGIFNTDTTSSWSAVNTSISYNSSGFMRSVFSGTSEGGVHGGAVLTVGNNYNVTFQAKSNRSVKITVIGDYGTVGDTVLNPTLTTSFQDYEFNISPTQTLLRIYMASGGSVDDFLDLKDIRLKEVLQSADLSDNFPALIDVNEPVLGVELLITTGWTTTDGWGLSNGILTFNDTGSGGTILSASDMTNSGLATGTTYKLQYTIGALSSGTADIRILDSNGNTIIDTKNLTNGSYTEYFSATSTNNGLGFRFTGLSSSGSSWTITDYSLKEVQGNVGTMTNQDSADLVYSSVLPDQSFLATGVNSAYNYIDLDGSDEYIDCGTGIGDFLGDNYAGDLSVSAWVKCDNKYSNDAIFYIGYFNGGAPNIYLYVYDNRLIFQINNWYIIKNPIGINTNLWHHVAFVYKAGDEDNCRLYLNGESVGNTNGTLPSTTDMDLDGLKTIVGTRHSPTYDGNWEGFLGQVALWNKELSSSEVSAIYTAGRHSNLLDSYADNLLLYLGMGALDAKTGLSDVGDGTIYDRSGNSNHGTATNTESADLASSPNAEPNGYAKGDTNRSTTTP